MAGFSDHLVAAVVKSPLEHLQLGVECHRAVRGMELIRQGQLGILERADWGWSLAEGWMEFEEGGAGSVRGLECPALQAEGNQFVWLTQHLGQGQSCPETGLQRKLMTRCFVQDGEHMPVVVD